MADELSLTSRGPNVATSTVMLRALVAMVLMVGCAAQEPASSSTAYVGACQLAYVPTCDPPATRLSAKLLGRLRLPVFHCDGSDRPLDASTLFESNETLAPIMF